MQGTGTGRVLANPKVRVMSGRKATFVSETQMPILTKDGDGEINTEWKNVGISAEMLPVVLDDGEIHITVTQGFFHRGRKAVGRRIGTYNFRKACRNADDTSPDGNHRHRRADKRRDIKNMSRFRYWAISHFSANFSKARPTKRKEVLLSCSCDTIVEPIPVRGCLQILPINIKNLPWILSQFKRSQKRRKNQKR